MALQTRKHQEDEDLSPFYQLQKSQVLHEAKAFNETPLDSRKCCSVLTELLCLLSQGEVLGKEEATTLFFGVTKLFQCSDPQLRRLVYLVIKELNKNQDDAFIVISSLEKDINGGVELFRANGLRVHSQVIDSSMLEQRARLFRQAIVNKNGHIASSALCAGIRMYNNNNEVVKRWQNETREATKSASKMVSFHALHLLYKMHSNDRRAVQRLVTSMINQPPESALARCLLIRYAFSCVLHNDNSARGSDGILEFIKDQIKQYKNPMVMFEAAKCLCHLPLSTEQDLTIAMNVLQEFLNSPRAIQRFAAVRALSNIVNKFNNILSPSCTVDLEHLITDGNRNIATLAITTLLQTTAEYSIERLLSSITEFMTEIADELKIVLITAIERVCEKFPKKYECLLNFLSMALREEGGYNYKNKIVDCMLLLMQENDNERAKEFGLESLCEFIEDCEYPLLSVRILYLIGELGPSTEKPSRYIRFIFNRVLLELPCVRAAAVSCLTKCAVLEPRLKNDIFQLLQRSLNDQDDEVRDRATLYCELLDNFKESEVKQMDEATTANLNVKEEEEDIDYVDIGKEEEEDEKKESISYTKMYAAPKELIDIICVPNVCDSLNCSLSDLESALLVYLGDNEDADEKDAFSAPFGVSDINKYKSEKREIEPLRLMSRENQKKQSTDTQMEPCEEMGGVVGAYLSEQQEWEKWLQSKQKDLPSLGVEICHSSIESLTEPEAEYQTEVIKRIYPKYIVLQFIIQQTIEKQLITDVYVDIDYDDSAVIDVTCPVIKCNGESGVAIAIIERNEVEADEEEEDEYYILGKYECVLKFIIKDDVGDDTKYDEGYEDSYTLNEIYFYHYDYIYAAKGDDILSTKLLKETWANIGKQEEDRKKGTLHFNKLQPAIDFLYKSVGLTAVEDSHKLDDDTAQQHALNLIAYTDKNEAICMRAAFVLNEENVSYKAAVRCSNPVLRTECLQSF